MTRTPFLFRARTWLLPAGAAALFLLLCAAFGQGLVVGPLWNGTRWVDSPLITYLLLGLIVAASVVHVNRQSPAGLDWRVPGAGVTPGQSAESVRNGKVVVTVLALPLRIFVGRIWLSAGLGKLTSPDWTGSGQALHGFWQSAVAVNATGQGKITYDWYRNLLLYMDGQHWYTWFAKLIVGGELLIGLALLLGGLVGIAALSGAFLNLNYGLAGVASSNPILLALGLLLAVAWRAAGHWGLDHWLLPRVDGTLRQPRAPFADRGQRDLAPA